MGIASIIGSGINGNQIYRILMLNCYREIASIIGSGINGNLITSNPR